MAETKREPLDRIQEIFDFLQGTVPPGMSIPAAHVPHLTGDQAWEVIHYIQELHSELPDHIERCDVCGTMFDSANEGGYTEDGPPHHFCDPCWDGHWLELEREQTREEDDG